MLPGILDGHIENEREFVEQMLAEWEIISKMEKEKRKEKAISRVNNEESQSDSDE